MADTELRTRPSHVLEDPSAKAVARVYAEAFLNAGTALGVAEPLEEFTSFHDEVIVNHPGFAELLASEMTSPEQKLGIIERVVQPRASEYFTNFLRVLARHGRLALLPLILEEAWLEQERRAGQRRVYVSSPVPLTETQLAAIRDRLQSQLNLEPILIPQTDPSLLGGLVIRVGDTIYDGSLKTRLRLLKQRLRERYLHEIQSGRDRFSIAEGN